uniref:DNA replication complex GINS protein SLD5 n=1 Tax=Chrysotila carterae TaxID=13221 RepID=A0A7S4F9L8_CHRCT|mmetsp:Transcript_4453/g.9675  ORF Transcript_4453/g.9675 Transcript_4453/m.9675 type:complete len:209 (+) Transcript_4453:110-736(+)
MTSQDDAIDVVFELQKAWLNEKFAPELLQHKEELVESALGAVQEQAAIIAELEGEKASLKRALYEMELERIQFVIREYLRIRLFKIQKYALHISKDEDLQSRLTEPERNLHSGYVELYKSHVERSVWAILEGSAELPKQIKEVDMTNNNPLMTAPKLESHVFCKALVDCQPFTLGDTAEVVQILKDDIHLLPYAPVRQLVDEGSIQLI